MQFFGPRLGVGLAPSGQIRQLEGAVWCRPDKNPTVGSQCGPPLGVSATRDSRTIRNALLQYLYVFEQST